MIWDIIVRIVVYAALSAVLAPKPKSQNAKAATLEDFDFPRPDPSANVPVIFGTVWIKSPAVVWYGDLRTEPVRR